MTGLAAIGGVDVPGGPSVTAGAGAAANHLQVIHFEYGIERERRMAGLAHVGRINVTGILACGGRAIVTAGAASQHLGVVDGLYNPIGIRRMACLAHVGRGDVCNALALRIRTVVARDTIGRDAGVIKLRWYPAAGGVADAALLRGRDVRGRFAGRLGTVMTARAGALHFVVIHGRNGSPCRRGMARRTIGAGGDVRRSFAFRQGAVMAGDARANHLRVVHLCRWRECSRGMARAAIVGGVRMCRPLAGCFCTVVA